MDDPTQARCNAIAKKLNERPRKRHGFRTPAELFENPVDVALQSRTCPRSLRIHRKEAVAPATNGNIKRRVRP